MRRPIKELIWYTTLLIDSMYFHAAKINYLAAKEDTKGIDKARENFDILRQEELDILDKHDGDHHEAYDELEPLYIQMEDAEYKIGSAYGPYLQHIAMTHIFCTTAAEAHINMVAEERLTGKHRAHFDRIPLEGKWLFLPKILGKVGFDPGAEPFQGFSMMIKRRNMLVHYKRQREQWRGFSEGEPGFLEELGLSLTEARRSLAAVKKIILALSDMIGRDRPYWLREGYDELPPNVVTNFFEIEIEKSN